MVATESVLVASNIDTSYNQDIAEIGIIVALLAADMEDDIMLFMEGMLTNILEAISSSTYREYLSVGKM